METAHVLGIEVRRAVNRIRERCRLRETLVQIPARECVCYAINRLGFRELLIHHIGRLGGVTGNIVLGSLLLKLRAARIAQVILYQCNILAFDGDIAVKMHIGVGPVVL